MVKSDIILSKDTGLTLNEHSLMVAYIADNLAKEVLTTKNYNKFNYLIRIGAQLHDIGKINDNFQQLLKGKKNKKNRFRHNETGWAMACHYISDNMKYKDEILNIIYWHHGISNKVNSYTHNEVLDTIPKNTYSAVKGYLVEVLGVENIKPNYETYIAPHFYNTNNIKTIPIIQLIRGFIISADRIASKYNNLEDVKSFNSGVYFNRTNTSNIGVTAYDGTYRFKNQLTCVDEIGETTIIKAPTGFGKTLVGMLASFKYKRKILIVCPTNTITKSHYQSFIDELEFMDVNPTVQLLLTGEVKKSNNGNLDPYNADVIILNIDNFLTPTFNNTFLELTTLIYGATVIFDEYHELNTTSPLMSVFINIMKARHRMTNSKTILMSATPTPLNHLWDSVHNPTKILPSETSHYKSAHDEKYEIRVKHDLMETNIMNNTIIIRNSIKNTQIGKINNPELKLIHGEFTEDKKNNNLSYLWDNHGFYSNTDLSTKSIIGTNILQSALNISFSNLIEDTISPESTLQRLGRCNRWGESDGVSKVILNFYDMDSDLRKSNNVLIDLLYNNELHIRWKEFLVANLDDKILTLNEIYDYYNMFNVINKDYILRYIQRNYDHSIKNIQGIYPIKIHTNKKKDGIITAGSNKLRGNGNETFFIVKNNNGEWVGPFNKQIFRSFNIDFKENSQTFNNILLVMKQLTDKKDIRFDYGEILKKKKYITLDTIRLKSKKSNTPYIIFNKIYDNELGLIDINFYNKINK